MPTAVPACPVCAQTNVYPDGDNLICADCAHEWPAVAAEAVAVADEDDAVVKDVNGVALANGDAVVLIKSLKLKGSSITLKQGTKIANIRLAAGDHEVDCRVDNMNVMLKACYLRKA